MHVHIKTWESLWEKLYKIHFKIYYPIEESKFIPRMKVKQLSLLEIPK